MGVLLIDKPAGVTSHDVVAAVRRALGGKRAAPRVGHAGTLDPFATGLLLVLLGRATKSQQELMALPKRYETVARLGASSTPATPRARSPTPAGSRPTRRRCRRGEVRQRPPRHSAVKVGGERAYRRARRGESFEMPERIVTVHRFAQLWRRRGRPAGPDGGVRDRVRLGHLRALADRRPRRRLLPEAAPHRDRAVRGRRRDRAARARHELARRERAARRALSGEGHAGALVPLERALAAAQAARAQANI